MQKSIPIYWRLKKSRYNLVGSKCTNCNSLFYPQRDICPECRRKGKMKEFRFSGKGKILSYTIINSPPEGFEKFAPYAVGIIKLEEGVNIPAHICGDADKIKTGKTVRPVFRKVYEDNPGGIIHYGLKFEVE